MAYTGGTFTAHHPKPPTIPSKPSDTELEFWIVENVDGINWAGHDTPYELYGGDAYLGKSYPLELSDEGMQIPKEYVIYTVTSWPDYSDMTANMSQKLK